jgi:hypothetical protein
MASEGVPHLDYVDVLPLQMQDFAQPTARE